VSRAVDGATTAKGKSEIAAISPYGNYVLLTSTATNLADNAPTNGSREVFLRDVAAGTTTWISHSDTHPYTARWPAMSVDARYVLFKIEFPLSNSAPVILYDRQADVSTIVTSNSRPAYPVSMSQDARFIAYDENNHIALWDRQTDIRTSVSDIPGSAASHSPRLSDAGDIVAFVSAMTNAPFQIYYRNMTTGQIRRLTENSAGEPSGKDHDGSTVVVDPQGEFILFDSTEDQLVENDRNRASDILCAYDRNR
jgi:Tol biopolymer transport system component